MKYCLVEKQNDSHDYETEFAFVYLTHCIMRSWRPEEANDIRLFNTVRQAQSYIEKNLKSHVCGPFDVVPADDVLLMIAELKLRET